MENMGKNPLEQEKNANIVLQKIISQAETLKVRPEDRDNEGHLLVYPNGPRSNLENELHWKIARTLAFKEWFGDWQNDQENASKIVDKNGEPLLVYHTSNKSFSEFDPQKSSHFWVLGKGSYFTPDPSFSSKFGDSIYSCFLNIKKLINIPKTSIHAKSLPKILFFSFIRPKDSALYEYSYHDDVRRKEMYGDVDQFSVLHKENIMILPNAKENPVDKHYEKMRRLTQPH